MAMQVSAPLVVATTENGRVMHLYKGDVVPKDVSKDSLDNLKSLGFVTGEEVDPIPESPEPVAAVAPAGNAGLEEWQEYARSRGASDADLDGKTRNELREQYGA